LQQQYHEAHPQQNLLLGRARAGNTRDFLMDTYAFLIIVLIVAAIVYGCRLYKRQCTASKQNDSAKARTSWWAIGSLIASVPGWLFGLSIFGFIFGIVALVCIHREKGQLSGRSLAVAGIVLGLIGGLFYYSAWLSAILEARAAHHRIKCQENIEAILIAIRQYASVHDGYLPARSDWKNAVSPFLRTKEDVFSCPEEAKGKESYIYLGDSTMKITDEIWTQGCSFKVGQAPSSERLQGVLLVCESRVRHTRQCGDTLGVGFADGKTMRIKSSELRNNIPSQLIQSLPFDVIDATLPVDPK